MKAANATAAETRVEILIGEPVLLPGRYVATRRIPLLPPFEVSFIEPGQSFLILERLNGDRMVLLAFANIRCWKAEGAFRHGSFEYQRKLSYSDRMRFGILNEPVQEERLPLDDADSVTMHLLAELHEGVRHHVD